MRLVIATVLVPACVASVARGEAHRTISGIAAGKDELLERALDVASRGAEGK